MSHRSAVVFGSGKMACGALGPLLTRAGYETLFVTRREELVVAINWHGGYRLTVAAPNGCRCVVVRHCRALRLAESDVVARAVAKADLVMTAVGIDNLWAIAPLIAEGLWRRSQALGNRRINGRAINGHAINVIACENLPGAGDFLRHVIVGSASREHRLALERASGFSAGLTRRIMTGGELRDGALWFAVSGPPELVVDITGLKGGFPRINGIALTEHFGALVTRKLFTVNLAQAVAAYVGHRYGCEYVHEAAVHPAVAPVIQGALGEACAALQAEFPRQSKEIADAVQQAFAEISNPALGDTIRRVARDPRRKLSSLERLVGPARLACRRRLPNDHICTAIAAALAYDEPADLTARMLQQTIELEGIDKVLTVDCGLLPYEALARTVKEQWLSLVTAVR